MMSFVMDSIFLDALSAQARDSTRLRSHHCLHKSHDDPVQRVIIAAEPGTYVRPHMHPAADKWELLSILRGSVDILIFDEQATLHQRITLTSGSDCVAIQIPPTTWHTLVVKMPGTVMLEVKPGPFDSSAISRFADWAPEEGNSNAESFLEQLTNLTIDRRVPQ